MEFEQRVIIGFLCREGADVRNIQVQLSAQFGDAAYSLRSVQRWYLHVRQGRKFLNDESRAGKPAIDVLDIQVLSSLEKQPFHSAYSLSEVLKVSHTTILNRFRDPLHLMKRCISYQLTEQPRDTRVQKCEQLPPLLESMAASTFRTIVTGDKIWFTCE
jgi:hypothetical protein